MPECYRDAFSTKIHCDFKLFIDAGPVVFAHCMKSYLAQSQSGKFMLSLLNT